MRVLLLAALLLAGCIAPAKGPDDGAPSPTPARVVRVEERGLPGLADQGYADPATFGRDECEGLGSWVQSDLFERLGNRPDGRRVAPEPHMAFDPIYAGLPERARYATHVGAHEGRDSIFLFPDAGVIKLAALMPPERTREEAAATFEAFATSVVEADAAERSRLFETFWSSRRPGEMVGSVNGTETVTRYSFEVVVDEPRIEPFVRALEANASAERRQVGSGVTLLWKDAGRYELRLAFAERRIVVDSPDGRLVLRVTEQPRASAFSPAYHDDPQAFIRGAMEHAGLPTPTFEGWVRDLGVC